MNMVDEGNTHINRLYQQTVSLHAVYSPYDTPHQPALKSPPSHPLLLTPPILYMAGKKPTIRTVSRNPLQKLQFDRAGRAGGEYEMSLLESTLEKITSLLRIGFGEAGANIIKVGNGVFGWLGNGAVDWLMGRCGDR